MDACHVWWDVQDTEEDSNRKGIYLELVPFITHYCAFKYVSRLNKNNVYVKLTQLKFIKRAGFCNTYQLDLENICINTGVDIIDVCGIVHEIENKLNHRTFIKSAMNCIATVCEAIIMFIIISLVIILPGFRWLANVIKQKVAHWALSTKLATIGLYTKTKLNINYITRR
jgi:hypothetical protein